MGGDLAKVLQAARKEFGEDAVEMGSDAAPLGRISTGIPSLDVATGGGYPKGGMTMVYGPEQVGKSAMVYAAMAEVHRNGGICALIDLERSFFDEPDKIDEETGELISPSWVRALEVDPEKVARFLPVTAEEVSENAVWCSTQPDIDLVIIDSIGAMASESELEEDGKKKAYGQSGLITDMVKKMQPRIYDNKQSVIMVNQVRDRATNRPGVTGLGAPGGHALHHACSVIVRMRRGGQKNVHTYNKEEVGFRPNAHVEKNKLSEPKKTAEFDLYHTQSPLHDKGIDYVSSLIFASLSIGIVAREGATYTIPALEWRQPGTERGQDNFINQIKSDPALYEHLRTMFAKHWEK